MAILYSYCEVPVCELDPIIKHALPRERGGQRMARLPVLVTTDSLRTPSEMLRKMVGCQQMLYEALYLASNVYRH